MQDEDKPIGVLADPPWKGFGAEKHFKTMPLKEIMAMPVSDLVREDSWCFLWIPNSLALEVGPPVLRAWGFEPAPQFITWFKHNHLGMGVPLRNSTEQLLVGRRGRPTTFFKGQPTHLFAPRGLHSEKPAEQIAIIERLVGPEGRLIELFARVRPSSARWLVWGDEIESDFSIPGYPVPSDFLRTETPS
jgi:N6-adenosine-specific RNA methylase IME4